MKNISVMISFAGFIFLQPLSQAACFEFISDSAPTRLGTPDGLLAGAGIWAQALVGLTSDGLMPLGVPIEHTEDGYMLGEQVCPPFANPDTGAGWVYVQLVAWDGRVWGTNFANVPTNQLGRTDIVRLELNVPPGFDMTPNFTQPAVVPPAPLRFATFTGSLSVSNGLFQLRAAGPAGSNVVVETSADLQAWTPVQTNALPSSVLDLSIPLSTNQSQFVRTRLVP